MSWEQMLDVYGYEGIWHRMRKLKSFRKYYQRWPFDDCAIIWPLEGDPKDNIHLTPEQRAKSDSYSQWLISQLPPAEQPVMELVAEGYKPRDIEVVLGKSSGSVRWLKCDGTKRLKKLMEK